MDSIRHFSYRTDTASGRVAVAINDDRVTIQTIAGQALPANLLPHLLDAMGQEFVGDCRAATYRRVNPFALQVRHGMSGCTDILLRTCRNAALADYPIAAKLHVSMYGKLNRGLSCWLGDLLYLAGRLQDIYLPAEASSFILDEVAIWQPTAEDWIMPPGSASEHQARIADVVVASEAYYLSAEVLAKLEEVADEFAEELADAAKPIEMFAA